MLLMRRLQSIGRRPVPTKSERPELEPKEISRPGVQAAAACIRGG